MSIFTNKDYYLISKLRKFNNYPAIEAFLTQAQLLIDMLPIVGKPHNFLCTLPASIDSMSLQIVNKTILKAEFQSKGKASFYYILPQASYNLYIQKSSNDKPLQLEAFTDGEEPYIFKFAYQTFNFENEIKDNWLETAKKAFVSYQTGIREPNFNHELYNLITDSAYKNEIVAFAQSNQPNPLDKMNLFFGKISSKHDTNQFKQGYYEADKGSTWFGELEIGDYAFILADEKVQLWKAREWKIINNKERLEFDIIISDTQMNSRAFVAFKYFNLDTNLIVITTRAVRGRSFFKISYQENLTEQILIDVNTYKNNDNFRKIVVFQNHQDLPKYINDIQLYYENGKLNIVKSDFWLKNLTDKFKDNTIFVGQGRKKKDKNLQIIKNTYNNNNVVELNYNVISITNFYDAFFCDYGEEMQEENEDNELRDVKTPLNQILFGAPGTGKTYHSVNEAISIVNPDFDLSQERAVIKTEFDRLVGEGQIQFVTFHQSFSYEDFVEGIKPVLSANNDAPIRYEIRSGVFKEMCINAKTPNASGLQDAYNKLVEKLSEEETITLNTKNSKAFSVYLNENENLNLVVGNPPTQRGSLTKDTLQRYINGEKVHHPSYAWGVVNYLQTHFNYSDVDNTPKKYVLIIDEINRGNVAQIFGELITLIEESKRAGKDEAIELVLPYSKDAFSVPANLYLIGTMNTADRSVEALDTALRRRFSFKEMRPDYTLLPTVEGVEVGKMLQAINARIELLLDKDHAIGHSYFLGLETIEDLRLAFENKLIPLLQEYFFGDFSKIGLVLGESFIALQKQDKKDIFAPFASVDKNLRNDLLRREVYHFTEAEKWDKTAFQGIYS